MKQAILNLMSSAGAFGPFREANRAKALILMYHRFSHGDESSSTSARAFGQHLEYLKEHYTLVTISQLAQLLKSGEPLPRSLATITIDDGFRDAYDVAFPLLRRYDAPATLFAVTDFLDQRAWIWTDKLRFLTSRTSVEMFDMSVGDHSVKCRLNGSESRLDLAARANELLKQLANEEKDEVISQIASTLKLTLPDLPPPEYAPLTWEQAREMDRNGVEIASHTLTHPILTKVSDEQLVKELQGSRARLETMLSRENKSFCYPNGNYDERVIQAVELAGYNCAVSTENGLNTSHSNLFLMRRIPANANFARFVKATSGFEQMQMGLQRSLRG
jgi:peptidoglycan/xylan/chitin deacetylase (PgdA/CDA1 family)